MQLVNSKAKSTHLSTEDTAPLKDSHTPAKNKVTALKEMQVKVEDIKIKASVAELTSTALKYCKMPVTCLPLPGSIDGHKALLKWKTQFKATTINSAANLDQPFLVNALLQNYFAKWWESVYDFTMEEYWTFTEDCADALLAIVEQILGNIFKTNEMTKEDIVIWVDEQYGKKDKFWWFYNNPDGALLLGLKKSTFQSDLILYIFVYHLKQASGAVKAYGLPIEGHALTLSQIYLTKD
ncbi:hypothetical protein H0H87_002251 [Tephrocybe sp. NHM501043]|nr:hypothetical protein H0H87_002251 [Tephrocybe sp. NHM501043]